MLALISPDPQEHQTCARGPERVTAGRHTRPRGRLANRFYVLEYCSPRRSGTHTLKVVATLDSPRDGQLVGSLSGQFDATGFSSGCEL